MLLQFKVSDCSRKNNVYVYVLNFLDLQWKQLM